jgi:hypothetical protein
MGDLSNELDRLLELYPEKIIAQIIAPTNYQKS